MESHTLSAQDRRFHEDFEAGRVDPEDFNHRAHVRLAYCYLAENPADEAVELVRRALHGFLAHHGVDPAKYHETLTRAWVLAVRHFMDRSAPAASADAFIAANPALLDGSIMLSHYSRDRLFSAEARTAFVDPDLEKIPGLEADGEV